MTEPHLYLHNLLFTHFAWLLSTSSASISAICSTLVIVFICRCGKLSSCSSYHKIMLFMSSWDFATSFAIALTTIPMPSNVHQIYPAFPGWAFGNVATCTCQGFIIVAGSMYTVWSNCTLNIYYVCTIKYGMQERTVNRCLLPIMLGISSMYVCILGGMSLSLGLYNPRPYEPYCLIGPYPHYCINEDEVECIRGEVSQSEWMLLVVTVVITGLLILSCTVVSMAMVIATVFKTESVWNEYSHSRGAADATSTLTSTRAGATTSIVTRSRENTNSNSSSSRDEEFNNTRTALRQALMYIAAFMLTWAWLAVSLFSGGGEKAWGGNEALKLFFQPLQGFFNASIFFSAKVSILRKSNSRLTKWQAFRQVIVSPWTVPEILVSHIAALDDNHHDGSSGMHPPPDEPRRLGSDDMPSVSVPSNDTPSIDYSRALTSNRGSTSNSDVELHLSREVRNVEDADADADADVKAHADHMERNQADLAHDNVKNHATAPTATHGIRRKGLRIYEWPLPTNPSSSSTGCSIASKIRSLKDSVHRSWSTSISDEEQMNANTTTKMNGRSLKSHDGASSSQEFSSIGSSVFCSANLDSVESGNLSSLPKEAGESFCDDDVHSRR